MALIPAVILYDRWLMGVILNQLVRQLAYAASREIALVEFFCTAKRLRARQRRSAAHIRRSSGDPDSRAPEGPAPEGRHQRFRRSIAERELVSRHGGDPLDSYVRESVSNSESANICRHSTQPPPTLPLYRAESQNCRNRDRIDNGEELCYFGKFCMDDIEHSITGTACAII